MPEQKREAKVIQVEYACDKCVSGFMRPNGIMQMSHPPLYVHVCDNCDATAKFRKSYPVIEYE